jgi:hypothetical protein
MPAKIDADHVAFPVGLGRPGCSAALLDASCAQGRHCISSKHCWEQKRLVYHVYSSSRGTACSRLDIATPAVITPRTSSAMAQHHQHTSGKVSPPYVGELGDKCILPWQHCTPDMSNWILKVDSPLLCFLLLTPYASREGCHTAVEVCT